MYLARILGGDETRPCACLDDGRGRGVCHERSSGIETGLAQETMHGIMPGRQKRGIGTYARRWKTFTINRVMPRRKRKRHHWMRGSNMEGMPKREYELKRQSQQAEQRTNQKARTIPHTA